MARKHAAKWSLYGHRGFTLVEMLFCLGVITVLSGLLFPALTHVRERARLTECTDRLGTIAKGMAAFQDTHKRLPPGALVHENIVMESDRFYENLDKAQWTSALGLCMPFLDLNTISDQLPDIAFDMDHLLSEDPARDKPFRTPNEIDNVGIPLATQVPLFECPSDNINDIAFPNQDKPDCTITIQVPRWDGVTVNDVDWAGHVFNFADGSRVMRTNYVSCIGAHGHQLTPDRTKWKGCMSTRGKVTLEDITDGTSLTIMMAENVGGIFNGERGVDIDDDDVTRTEVSFAWSHFFGGICQGRGNIPYLSAQLKDEIDGYGADTPEHIKQDEIPMLGNSKFSPMRGFGSMHPKGVNVMLADGSVRTLDRSIDWEILYQICGLSDGGTPMDF